VKCASEMAYGEGRQQVCDGCQASKPLDAGFT
jgi:hypothetical protein